MDAKRAGPAWQGGALGALLLAAILIVAVVGPVGRQPGGSPSSPTAPEPAATDPVSPSASAEPSASVEPTAPASLPLPSVSPIGYGLDGSGWFQLDAPDDGTGAITRYVLTAGTLGRPGSFTVDLPNPAFAAGPFGDLVLFGGDDGKRSEVAVLSLVDGSLRVLLTSDQPVWRATLDNDANNLYYVLSDRTTRADLGIWRLRLDGAADPELIDPAPPDGRSEPRVDREFVWGPASDVLAVYTCWLGVGCQTRVLDVGTGKVRSYNEVPLHGDIIGLTADSYVAYETCPGFPCPIIRVDLATANVEALVDGAGGGYAALVQAATGPLLVYEAPFVPDYQLLGLDSSTRATRKVYTGPTDGPTLLSSIQMQSMNIGLPPGWLVLSPQGQLLPLPGTPGTPIALQVRDGAQVPLTGLLAGESR